MPRLALGASAGPGALAGDEAADRRVPFLKALAARARPGRAALSAIAVTGDSMEPVLRDGDEVLVDRTPRPLRDGIHVVRMGERCW